MIKLDKADLENVMGGKYFFVLNVSGGLTCFAYENFTEGKKYEVPDMLACMLLNDFYDKSYYLSLSDDDTKQKYGMSKEKLSNIIVAFFS